MDEKWGAMRGRVFPSSEIIKKNGRILCLFWNKKKLKLKKKKNNKNCGKMKKFFPKDWKHFAVDFCRNSREKIKNVLTLKTSSFSVKGFLHIFF